MISESFITELKRLLGAGDDLTADNALSYLKEYIERNDQKISDLLRQKIHRRAPKLSVVRPDPESLRSMQLGAGLSPKNS